MALWILPGSVSPALAQSGGVDGNFKPGFDNEVFTVRIQPDGKVLASGFFTKVGNANRRGIARLNADGSVDTTFNPAGTSSTNGLPHTCDTCAVQTDGRVILGGRFTTVNNVARGYLARLNSDGSLDTNFLPIVEAPFSVPPVVVALAIQLDGKILIGGEFNAVNGTPRNYIARVNPNGSLDADFDPGIGLNASPQAIALQTNGAILIGGQFTTVNGATRIRVARLNPNGSLDTSFDIGAGPDAYVAALSLQPDGKIIIGGRFTAIGGVARLYVARLSSDGSLDTSFQPNIALGNTSGVLAVQTEVDGKVLVGGSFATIDGSPRKNLARLNADGSLDTTFLVPSGPSGGQNDLGLFGIAIQQDGKVLVGGDFTTFNGVRLNYVARLLADQGGAVEFASANYTIDENGGSAMIAVRRTGSTNGSVAVNYLTIDGTATAGADYVAQAGALLFGPGETSKVFTVPILPDALVEPSETVNLVLGNPIGGVILGTNQTATLTIINNTNSLPNSPPVLPMQADRTIDEMTTLIVTNTASDADVPANILTYRLVSPPSGATNDANGVIRWTPGEAQGPSTNTITTVVTDDGVPPLSATNSFTVIVREVNSRPALPMQADRTIDEMTTMIVTNTASDADVPANVLTYRLVSPPSGVTNDANGVIRWTPGEAQGPSTNTITTVVTDDGSPPLSATNSFTVIVKEVNSAPMLSPISDQLAFAGFQLTITNSASDMDFPINILTFSLAPGAPATAAIDPVNGVFTWTPPTDQVPGTNTVTVRVTDDGVPSLDDTKSFKIVVASPPVIESIVSSNGNVTITWSAIAGKNYQVQFKTDLSETTWNILSGDVPGTGATATKTDTSVSGNRRFYRVGLLL